MCRLMMASYEGVQWLKEVYGLGDSLKYLEDSFGGNGNGVGLIKNGKISFLRKGVRYKVRKIAKEIEKREFDWMFFHTRLASIGGISDKNCHPFRHNNNLLAMNGTISDLKIIANELGKTDSETVLLIASKLGISLKDYVSKLSSTFIGEESGKVFVTANNNWNDLEFILDKEGNPLVFSSEFPLELYYQFDIYKPLEYPFIWQEGEKIDFKKIIHAYPSSYQKGNYLTDYYDNYYFGGNDSKDSVTEEEIVDFEEELKKHYTFNEKDGVWHPKGV